MTRRVSNEVALIQARHASFHVALDDGFRCVGPLANGLYASGMNKCATRRVSFELADIGPEGRYTLCRWR